MSLKKIVMGVAALGMALALANCGQTPQQIATTISGIESQVQADTNLACGFIPTVATIAGLIPAVGSFVADAATIAESVCAAVAAAPPVVVASVRRNTVGNPNATPAKVATVVVPQPGGGTTSVPIAGTFTR
jgi:hypothetical protein